MHDRSLAELSRSLRAGAFSSAELTEAFLQRIERHNPVLNALITVSADQARLDAEAADRRIRSGGAAPLTGIPIVHKDIFCTAGILTSCGSKILANFVAPYDATVVARCKAEGMVMLGKANLDEFAMGSSTETSYYGPTRNPWHLDTVAGGSSGGSAAAVAARLAPVATGTDTGGSVRQPAALTGLTGLKPTYGRVSRWGMIAFASSLDQGGLLARSAEDAALLLQAIAGFDDKDSTSADQPVPDYSAQLAAPLTGLKIGLPREYFGAGLEVGMAQVILAAVDEYRRLGAEVIDLSLPNANLAVPAYYVIAPAEASSNLARFDGVRYGYRCANPKDLLDLYTRSRGEGFGTEVKRRIMIGTYALSAGYYDAYYRKAQQIRRLISDDFQHAFQRVDVIMGPTFPTPAFKLGARLDDPVTMYLSDIYTVSVNLAGLPALSIPAGFIAGLPVGLQIIGDYFTEAKLLNIAHRYQQETDWHKRAPTAFV
ncbi:MAG: Asp-tRNA(Asn)/Glu-tRNA(Gln) amidotransferase subunit GatA [Gammaproteobacteria bacterium]